MSADNYRGPWTSRSYPDYWGEVPTRKQAELVTAWIAVAKENGDPVTTPIQGASVEQTHQVVIVTAVEAVSHHLYLVTSGVRTLPFKKNRDGANSSFSVSLTADLDALSDESLDDLLRDTYHEMTPARPAGVKAACELICK